MSHIVQFHARSNDKNIVKNMFLHVYVLNTRILLRICFYTCMF